MRERTALVTGGSTGIGESICKHFLEAGYTVLNLARRPAV
ncbi:MAG: SDR family NAD(P)-dependent oxidoreductase, partial [Gammaproteobacteria bacterium]|nr:SDR family NAD(P)-dependent oxidoreductase [Gammaproteobacteria bacterium]